MISKGFKSISLADIRKVYSDYDVARKVLGIQSIPCVVCSPLRDDKRPSLGFYYTKSGNIGYKDFATNDQGSLYDFLGKLWNKSYNAVISDLSIELGVHNNVTLSSKPSRSLMRRTSSTLEVKVREFRDYDLEFWGKFGISKEWLKFGEVYPITTMFFTKGGVTKSIPADKYAYAYVERKDDNVTIKVYQPFSERVKWLSKHDSSVWDLWTKLPESGDKLIITSSRKDALCLWANTGIPAVSLQGEGYIPKKHVVDQLKSRFKTIYVLYDNDFKSEENHGRLFGKYLSDTFGLIQIEIPDEYQSKDPSDLYRDWGKDVFLKVILSLIE